jgi:hypothetical protein
VFDDGGTDGGQGDCVDGEVVDCSGDGDCCPESWIGDGFADCEDQAYGCDLTCYDNDGGDCAEGGTTGGGTTGGGSESCESCEFDFTAYGSECCDTAWEEFGINCADLELTYYWDCSGCSCLGDSLGSNGDNFSEKNVSRNNSIKIFDKIKYSMELENNYEELNNKKLFNLLNKNLDALILSNTLNEENNLSDLTSDKEYIHGHNITRDLLGYNVVRDGSDIAFTTQTSYDDSNVQVEFEYCYTVEAVYDEGVSSQTNTACASALPVPNSSDMSVGNAEVSVGDTQTQTSAFPTLISEEFGTGRADAHAVLV